MLKKLGIIVAAVAMAVPALPASATVPSSSASFNVKANVSALATLSFGLASSAYDFGTIADNTNSNLAAGNNTSGTINASVRSTTTGGSASIYVTAPASIAGTNGGSIPINDLYFTCTGSYTINNAGGTQSSGVTTGVNTTETQFASGSGNTCVTFTNGASVASSALFLNLFLDDRHIAADTYNGGNFSLVVSAT